MQINYTTDTSTWEPWQHDYRFDLILILPPPEIAKLLDPLRARYDPFGFAMCPTHISISDPLQRKMTPALDDEITRTIRGIAPFAVSFDTPLAAPDYAGVAYPIVPQAPIDDLKRKLH